ncbi:MAG: TonB-dependent receptor [Sphingobium sp.]
MRKASCRSAIAAIALAVPVSGWAQQAAPQAAEQADQDGIQDIVVTANRREERLQNVGVSISALSGEQMRALGVATALDVANFTPNIEVIRSYASPGFNTQITIRGVGQPDFQDTTEATATAYVDEFYMIGAGQADFLSFDIARTEVARGPQGTVQGRNATAGSINYYTNRPSFAGTSGRASVTFGSWGTIRSEGYINLPLGDTLAIRGAFSTDTSDGYLRNINPTSNWRRGAAGKFYAGRLQALYKPNESLSLLLKAEIGKMGPVAGGNEKAYSVGQIAGLPGTYAIPADAFGQNQANIGAAATDVTNADGSNELESKMQHYLATLNYDAGGGVNVTLLGGWLETKKYSIEDCDHTPLPVCNFSNKARSRHWTAEGRVNWDADALRLTVGANYLHHEIVTTSASPLFFGPTVTPFGTTLYGQAFRDEQKLNSYALFGQAEYDLTDQLTVIAGVRYTHDNKVLNSVNAVTTDLPLDTPLPRTIDEFEALRERIFATPGASFTVLNEATNGSLARFKKGLVNANVQLNYKPSDDMLLYLSYKRGQKSGGFITGNVAGTPAAIRPFGEETNNAYEFGVKSDLLHKTLRVNGAVFYYDYQNMQNTSLIGITNVITNNDAKIWGGEVEVTAYPTRGLSLNLSGGYIHSKVKGINNPTGAVAIVSDNRLPLAPSWTGNARIRYEWAELGGKMFVQGAGRGRTYMYRDSLNNPSTKIPGLFVADAQLGYMPDGNGWSVSLQVNNVFNTRKPINLFDISTVGNGGEVVYQMPRWFGGTVSVSF